MYRIGLGKDIHRLIAERPFILGGVQIPSDKGEDGHSDGDVLAHAITDALLGAGGFGDIGEFFPPGDPKYKNADSVDLLKKAWKSVSGRGWRITNIDCVITCETPKILPFRQSIRESLALALGIETGKIFLKGKTAEGLDSIGRGEAVEALAVCLLEK